MAFIVYSFRNSFKVSVTTHNYSVFYNDSEKKDVTLNYTAENYTLDWLWK